MLSLGVWPLGASGMDLRPVFSPSRDVCHKTPTRPAPVPSRRPAPRQPIPGVTQGLCFLGYPSHPGIRLAAFSTRESPWWVTPFRMSIWRGGRPVLYAGPHRSDGHPASAYGGAKWGPIPFGPACQPFRQVPTDDASTVPLLALAVATRWGPRDLRLVAYPLFALALRRLSASRAP